MGVDGDGTDEHSWSVDPEDEQGVAVVAALGRQMRARREALGMRVGDLAAVIQYGEALIYKVEGGKRIAKPEYLDEVDDALKAGGLIRAMREDLVADGTAVGRSEGAFNGRPVSDPKRLRTLDLRYGMLRAQALTPHAWAGFVSYARDVSPR